MEQSEDVKYMHSKEVHTAISKLTLIERARLGRIGAWLAGNVPDGDDLLQTAYQLALEGKRISFSIGKATRRGTLG